jgi:hypothetical protein
MLVDALKEELETLCEDNNLNIDFDFEFPIRVTVRKTMQMHMLKPLPEKAYLEFRFLIDDLKFEFFGNFKIDEKLFAKFLNKIKKFHYVYLQEQYEQKPERFKNCIKPLWKTRKGDYVALVKRYYEG